MITPEESEELGIRMRFCRGHAEQLARVRVAIEPPSDVAGRIALIVEALGEGEGSREALKARTGMTAGATDAALKAAEAEGAITSRKIGRRKLYRLPTPAAEPADAEPTRSLSEYRAEVAEQARQRAAAMADEIVAYVVASDEPVKRTEIAMHVGNNSDALRRALAMAVDDGRLRKVRGGYRTPDPLPVVAAA